MRILFVCTRNPCANGTADQITTYKAIEYLREQGNDVKVIVGSISEKRGLFFYLKVFFSLFFGLFRGMPVQVGIYSNPHLRKVIEAEVESNSYDVVYAHLIRSMILIPKRFWKRVHLGMQISQYLNLSRVAKQKKFSLPGIFYWVEANLCRVFEKRVIALCHRTNLVAEADFKSLNCNNVCSNKVSFIPHGININDKNTNNVQKRYDFIFLGNFSTETNKDALNFLIKDIWPKIKNKSSIATLALAGRNLDADLLKRNLKGIEVLGEVDSAIDTTAMAWVSLNPVRAAAGMQNKVLTALAANCHVVATDISVEGMNIPDKFVTKVPVDSDHFANAAYILLKKAKSSANTNRQKYIQQNWSWDALHKRWTSEFIGR